MKSPFKMYKARADQVAYISISETPPDSAGFRDCAIHFVCGHDAYAAVCAFDGKDLVMAMETPWKHQCRDCILVFLGEKDE